MPEAASRDRPVAIVTGASAGIGAAFAVRLARDGYDLVLVARRAERLRELAARLGAAHGGHAEALAADLSDPAALHALEARLARESRLALLVNNAGFGLAAPFAEAEPAALEAMLAVHVTAVVRLTRAALPVLAARGGGAIVNVASAAAFATRPNFYAATKAFVVEFTKGLQAAAAERGVRVQALCPAWTRTEFFEALGRPFPAAAEATMTPEALVDAALTGLTLGEVVCVPALDAPALLEEIDARRGEIMTRAGATGIPARRYGAPSD